MAKSTRLPKAKIIDSTGAKTDEFTTKVFAKSEYPKTIKQNIRVFLNLVINFFC